jgi:hypothetical protein
VTEPQQDGQDQDRDDDQVDHAAKRTCPARGRLSCQTVQRGDPGHQRRARASNGRESAPAIGAKMQASANRVKKIAVVMVSSEAVIVVCTRVIGHSRGVSDGDDPPLMYG